MTLNASPRAIKEALKVQIDNWTQRVTNVYAYGTDGLAGPRVVMISPDDYIQYFETFGSDGLAGMELELKVTAPNAGKIDAQIALDDYLSVGTNNPASLVDAVNSSNTLGGLVQSIVCLRASGPGDVEDADEITATLYVSIVFKKVGTQV